VTSSQRNIPELLLGLGIMAVGVLLAVEAATIKVGPLYAKVGPGAFLWFSAALLLLCGAVVAFKATQNRPDSGNELRGPLIILAGLAASVFLLEPIGFIPTATLIFTATANGLGSHRILRDLAIGLVISIIAYVVFGLGLGLRLPLGNLFT
jgi:putative tricarboxylic transport membrane protein